MAGDDSDPADPDPHADDADARDDADTLDDLRDLDDEDVPRGARAQHLIDEVESRIRDARNATRHVDREARKTVDEVFDRSTLLTLYKLMSNGHVDTLDYPVSTGKEANVFHGTDPQGESVAVKIFRVNTATFRSFMTYIQGDPRFQKVRHNRRDVVHAWTQKEYKNLHRMMEARVRVPRPFAYSSNVLVMDFVGVDGVPAPRLKESPAEDPRGAYEDIAEQYRRMVVDAGCVHGDLSEFNILHQLDAKGAQHLTVIDVAQSVLTRHPMSGELMARDAKNLARYFKRQGVDCTPEDARERFLGGKTEEEVFSRGAPKEREDAAEASEEDTKA